MKRYYCMVCRKIHRLKKSKIGKRHWRLGFGEKISIGTKMDLEEWSKLPRRSRKTLQGIRQKLERIKTTRKFIKCITCDSVNRRLAEAKRTNDLEGARIAYRIMVDHKKRVKYPGKHGIKMDVLKFFSEIFRIVLSLFPAQEDILVSF